MYCLTKPCILNFPFSCDHGFYFLNLFYRLNLLLSPPQIVPSLIFMQLCKVLPIRLDLPTKISCSVFCYTSSFRKSCMQMKRKAYDLFLKRVALLFSVLSIFICLSTTFFSFDFYFFISLLIFRYFSFFQPLFFFIHFFSTFIFFFSFSRFLSNKKLRLMNKS